MRSLLIWLMLGSAAWAGSGPDSTLDPNALKNLVHQDCGSCHGMTLKGGLGPDLRAQKLQHYDPADLSAVILDGIKGTPMPPWRPLMSEDEAMWIAKYLLNGGKE